MKKLGRPTSYTKEMGDAVCDLLSEGISLRTICLNDKMPDKSTVLRWIRSFPDFRYQYAVAKEESTDAMNEDLSELGDEAIRIAQAVDPKASGAVVQAVKLKADNMKWVMSKMKPKKYGDKIDMTTNGKDLPAPMYGGASTKI